MASLANTKKMTVRINLRFAHIPNTPTRASLTPPVDLGYRRKCRTKCWEGRFLAAECDNDSHDVIEDDDDTDDDDDNFSKT
jgi:hypothetical protein